MSGPQFPRWLIDDTTGIANGRIFVAHLALPRFVGELLPDEEAPIDGVTFSAPCSQSLCRIYWIDEPVFDAGEIAESLARAINHHDSVRG